MNSLLAYSSPFSQAAVEQLGWILIHTLWQLTFIAVVGAVVVRAMRQNAATMRYRALVIALAVSTTAPLATWSLYSADPAIHDSTDLSSAVAVPANAERARTDSDIAQSPAPSTPQSNRIFSELIQQVRTTLQPWLVWLVVAWSLGVVICSARPLLGWHTLRRLQRVGGSPVPDVVLASLHRAISRLRLQQDVVQIFQSTLAQAPIVVGYLRPIILLPVSLATSIPPSQLEAILAHELAHIRRHDFVVNLIQTLVETLFFYHPAIWWLSHRIRIEREHCCDDLVVASFDDPIEYGRALLAIEEFREQQSILALGATDGSLLSRVRRIVGLASHPSADVTSRWPAAFVSLICVSAILVTSISLPLIAKDEPGVVSNLPQQVLAQAPTKTLSPAERESTVVGTVVTPDRQPVAGIEVLAFQGGKQYDEKFTTDSRGQFRVPKAWRKSDHYLTLVARDGDKRLGWFDFFFHGHSSEGQKSEDGSFELVLLPLDRTIRGQLVNNGKPLAQIPVQIEYLQHDTNFASAHWQYQKINGKPLIAGAITDNEGRFEVKLPAASGGWLGTTHADWVHERILVPKQKSDLDLIKLTPAAKVAGRVTDSRTGKPVAGVEIGVQTNDTGVQSGGWGEGKTDANGNYVVGGLAAGDFSVILEEGADKTLTAPAHASIVLKSGETSRADFSLIVGRRLTGRVLLDANNQPIFNCTINYTGPARPGAAVLSTMTNERGEFEFIVPPGKSSVYIGDNRQSDSPQSIEVVVPTDRDPDPVVLKTGPKLEGAGIKIFVGPPLDRKVSFNLKRTPLQDALTQICQLAGIKLELDGDGLKNEGYTRNMPVTATADTIPLRDALTLILDPYKKLSFTLDKDVIFVSTQKRVEARESQSKDSGQK